MNRFFFKFFLLTSLSILFTLSCTTPQYIWPQKDVQFYQNDKLTSACKILIASRNTEFKNAVVQKIREALNDKEVYIKVIGIEKLKDENANQYSAVVVINTVMGWRIDRKVEAYLKEFGNLESIFVLSTSAGGDILPDLKNREIDAISCASTKEKIEPVVSEIIGKLEILINSNCTI